MIIPVRCFTCGKVIGNKWEMWLYLRKTEGVDSERFVSCCCCCCSCACSCSCRFHFRAFALLFADVILLGACVVDPVVMFFAGLPWTGSNSTDTAAGE